MKEHFSNSTAKGLLSRYIAHFNRYTFAAFIKEHFSDTNYYDSFDPLPEAGEDVFCQPFLDSYGGSIHEVIVLHFPPLELFKPSETLSLADPVLIKKLNALKAIYHKKIGHWGIVSEFLRRDDALKSIKFVTNLFGIERKVYDDTLIPAYERLQHSCGLKKPRTFVGSCDSFVDLDMERTLRSLDKLAMSYSEGVAISITAHGTSVSNFTGERIMASGVSAGTRSAYEPIMVQQAVHNQAILEEFSKLIQTGPSEARLEEFLVAHYRDIFGLQYDQIETQLWLRFPELDIRQKNRRLDIFLRNSIKNDWDLFEVKRPISLTASYRDVPSIVAEVSKAIHQARNYQRILAQDKVKKHFASEGIEYYEPTLNLVIGRAPQIPHAEWRWLETVNTQGVRLFTFDELLKELRQRYDDRYLMLEKLVRPMG